MSARSQRLLYLLFLLVVVLALVGWWATRRAPLPAPQASGAGPVPLTSAGQAVDWWFAYKFSAHSFPLDRALAGCAFGGQPRSDPGEEGLRFAMASSAHPALTDGPGLIGTGPGDPLGATFAELWQGHYYFVVWNDQFYGDPVRHGPACDEKQCGKPWGHSKGMVAWDAQGRGVLLQVTTPSWPGSGTARIARADGNSLGCISDDNDTANAQHFFALRLDRDDLRQVLRALATASVSTDIANPQIVNRRVDGRLSAPDIDDLVGQLGQVSGTREWLDVTLSSGVRLIAKPSALHVPPWQFVSSLLGGENLLTATWWAAPRIAPTRAGDAIPCWDNALPANPGTVDIALSSRWDGAPVGFTGAPNHAKIAVSERGGHGYTVFGDLNQQGRLGEAGGASDDSCGSSQNGRGGLFFVLHDPALHDGVARLLDGTMAAYAP